MSSTAQVLQRKISGHVIIDPNKMKEHLNDNVVVLGAGMTGLGAGLSGLPVFEAAEDPGGICSSYYMRP